MKNTDFEIWADKLSTTIAYGVRYTFLAGTSSAIALIVLLRLLPVNYTLIDCFRPIGFTLLFWVLALPGLGLYVQHKSTQIKG